MGAPQPLGRDVENPCVGGPRNAAHRRTACWRRETSRRDARCATRPETTGARCPDPTGDAGPDAARRSRVGPVGAARRAARLLGAIAAPLAGALACSVARPAAGRASPAALAAAHVERLYFGRNIGDTAVVSDSAWAGFVRAVLTPAFPDGATVWAADGRWRAPDGTPVREPSFVVELVHAPTADAEARVRRVVAAYKRRFAQQAVLRVVTAARAEL